MRKNRRPKHLTASQFAAKIGKSRHWVLGMLREDRIPSAELLPLGWIIPEDAQIILRHTDLLLPPELVLDIVPRNAPEYKDRAVGIGNTGTLTVELPGYERATKGMTKTEVQRKTGVHIITQNRILEGKPVKPETARKIARGLDVEVETLLRRK